MKTRIVSFSEIQKHPFKSLAPSDYISDEEDEPTDEEIHEEEQYEADKDNPTCPLCNGPGSCMGGLGNLTWFRCRNCGVDFNIEEEPE